MQSWLRFLSTLAENGLLLGHRQLMFLSGEQDWAWAKLQPWLATLKNNHIISQNIPANITGTQLASNKPANLLGYESDSVVFNCHDGLYPDALTAISGTLKSGGIMFILCPHLEEWPNYSDQFSKNRTPHNHEVYTPQNHNMITRLINKAYLHGAHVIEQRAQTQIPSLKAIQNHVSWQVPTTLTNDQKNILKTVAANLSDLAYCHIITADRGRGKSHLLGLLALSLEESNIDNGIKCYITAPNKSSCQAVFNAIRQKTPTHNCLTFIPPEKVLCTVTSNDVLFIDEAASLPINLLIQFSEHFNKLILATTTHGYEGTGKGFQLRFLAHLKQPNLKHIVQQHTLTAPVRYSLNDPLENWVFDSFCLNSEPKGLSITPPSTSHPLINSAVFKVINQQELTNNNELLEDVFGLLVQAHYQTRPSDLRDILDAPGFTCFGLLNNEDTLLAVCLISDEGPVLSPSINPELTTQPTPQLQQDIFNGLRRPKGHLIPQVLAHHMGIKQALNLKGARIIRIAALPNLQKQNLGSTLLQYIGEHLRKQNYDYLGSSYADTHDVTSFWLKNNFKKVRIGSKQDGASGTHSALVIKGLGESGEKLQHTAQTCFLNSQHSLTSLSDSTETEQELIKAFIEHFGSYESAKQILKRIHNWPLTFPKKASKEFKQQVKNWLNAQ